MGFPSSAPANAIDFLGIRPIGLQQPPSSDQQAISSPISGDVPFARQYHSSSWSGDRERDCDIAAAQDMTDMELLIVEVLRTMKGCQEAVSSERRRRWLPYGKSNHVEDKRVQPRFRYVSDLYSMTKAKNAVTM